MNSEKKPIIVIFVALVLIYFMIFAIIKPAFSEIKILAEKIEKKQENLESFYQKGKTLAQAKNELREIEEKKNLLDGVFLTEGKELEFITTLEKIAMQNNVLQDVNLKERQSFQGDYKLMPVFVSLRGSFKNLVRYFLALENLDFYLNVNSLNITILPGKDDNLNAILELKTYWRTGK